MSIKLFFSNLLFLVVDFYAVNRTQTVNSMRFVSYVVKTRKLIGTSLKRLSQPLPCCLWRFVCATRNMLRNQVRSNFFVRPMFFVGVWFVNSMNISNWCFWYCDCEGWLISHAGPVDREKLVRLKIVRTKTGCKEIFEVELFFIK